MDLVEKGLVNLKAHIENITKHFGLPVVVSVNRFSTDTDRELELICAKAKEYGAFDACISKNWELGGEGAVELGKSVIRACKEAENNFRFTYDDEDTIKVINSDFKIDSTEKLIN